jgi:hypothetical protein
LGSSEGALGLAVATGIVAGQFAGVVNYPSVPFLAGGVWSDDSWRESTSVQPFKKTCGQFFDGGPIQSIVASQELIPGSLRVHASSPKGSVSTAPLPPVTVTPAGPVSGQRVDEFTGLTFRELVDADLTSEGALDSAFELLGSQTMPFSEIEQVLNLLVGSRLGISRPLAWTARIVAPPLVHVGMVTISGTAIP